MMRVRLCGVAVLVAALSAPAARAQDGPKPGPEHEVLKKHVGTWDITMKFEGGETKGTAVYKMDLGGLWLTSSIESELFGQKFTGKGFDTYDAAKKKYVAVWMDSMSASPLIMEGDFDQAKKALTMTGTGPGMDGNPAKYRSVTTMPDDDTINFAMYVGGDDKTPAFTIVYKRKK